MSSPRRESYSTASLTVALSLFSVTAYWMVQHRQKERRRDSARRSSRRINPPGDALQDGVVGPRGDVAFHTPAVPYLKQFLLCLENPCDPVHSPQGYIPLCIAENRLVLDMLMDRFLRMTSGPGPSNSSTSSTSAAVSHNHNHNNNHNNNQSAVPSHVNLAFSDPRTYCYNSFLGMPLARDAAAYFLARRFLFQQEITATVALQHIQPQHIAWATGAAALLHHLFVLLGNPDAEEACLIPQPYYAAFDNHMQLVGRVTPCGIPQTNPLMGPSTDDLDRAHRTASEQGLTPRFLLITNPNNPLGVIYSPSTIRRLVDWARHHRMHIIVDELYALSVHKTYGRGFESVIKVLNNELGNDVHMLWAISKDFGASGLRVGMLYSQNETLLEALTSVNIFTCVAGPIQYLVAELLTDDAFVTSFLESSRNRLLYSYQVCVAKLEEMVLPYVPAEAGVFVYVDFSSLLPQPPTLEWEARLSDLMFEYARVVLTPGGTQHDTKPGMFRICYAWVSVDVLQVAMERLSRLVAKIRRMDWDDLNDRSLAGVLDAVQL